MKGFISTLARLALAFCVWIAAAPSPARAEARSAIGASGGQAAAAADPYLIVDCLLPGATRRLGARMVIAGRRTPARIPARDCEIRGGEYATGERASWASSLAIWTPLALEGDARAQLYVGDMHARGVAGPQNFAEAARWYEMAARQGYGPAMFSLGALYENGQGVPANKQTAMNWYRRAAGLSDARYDDVSFGSASNALEPALQAVRAQLDAERSRSSALHAEIRRLQTEASARERAQGESAGALALERARIEAEKATIARERADAQAALRAAGDGQAAVRAARAELTALTEREQAIAARERAAAAQDAEIARKRSELDRVQSELARQRDSLAAAASGADAEARRALEAERGQNAALREEIRRLQVDAARRQSEATAALTALQQERERITAEKQAIAAERNAVARSAAAHGQSAAATEARLAEISQREQAIAARERAVADRESQTTAQRRQLETLQADLERRRAALPAPPAAAQSAGARMLAPSQAPQIVMLDPQIQPTRGNPVIYVAPDAQSQVISGQVRTAQSGLMTLTINGARAHPTDAGVFGAEIPITGQTSLVQIVAVDGAGQRSELRFELRRAAPTATPSIADRAREIVFQTNLGKFHALLIGNSHYRNGWNELKTPFADIDAMGDVLQRRYGFEVTKVRDATREGIGAALYELRRRVGENDSVIIYYAGHGAFLPTPTGDRGYWIPVDGDRENPTNWIAADTIHEWVGVLQARKVLVISDSCFSGLLMRSASAFLQVGRSEEAQLTRLRNEAEGKSRTYLTSGRDAPVLDQGGGDQHSIFARALIDTLKENGEITTGRAVAAQVETAVLELSRLATRGTQSQQPDYQPMRLAGHSAGDFIFVPRAN